MPSRTWARSCRHDQHQAVLHCRPGGSRGLRMATWVGQVPAFAGATVSFALATAHRACTGVRRMSQWYPLIFVALMALAMLVYVVLDGYDLGVGILLRGADDADKDTMIASIGPFWDANETWLV